MLSRLKWWFLNLPFWGQLALAGLALTCVHSAIQVWGEKRFVGGLAEQIVASVIVDGSLLTSFVVGIGVGAWLWKRLPRAKWIAWVVGLTAFVAVGSIRYMAEGIPGVGWRVEQMNNYEPVDY